MLSSIAKQIDSCRKCSLYRGRNKAVPGEGNFRLKILLVGEAPGREEDLTGRPFVGRAGRLLDRTLDEIGLSREEVFITSVVKCRPEKNRTPRKVEIRACLPHLLKQIEVLNPSVVVPLGNVALEALTGKKGISKLRGKPFRVGTTIFLPTYHPAAVLRNINLLKYLKEDLKKAKALKYGMPEKAEHSA